MSSSSPAIVRIKKKRALPFFSRHPWVFAGAIHSVSGHPGVGAHVTVNSFEGQFIAHGLYNPESNIRARLYSWGSESGIDESLIRSRIERAVCFRQKMFGESDASRACRLIFSESDGLSGLTVDRYGDWLVLQWTSAALHQYGEVVLSTLQDLLLPRGVWIRTEKGIKQQEGLDISDGLIAGDPPPSPLFIKENGIEFEVDLTAGQKTGYYFDQRSNRTALNGIARGGRLLDVCCYTGGFAISAAVHGHADQITAVDSSASALEIGQRNAERNGVANRIEWENQDAFDFLESQITKGAQYDTIILDPPKLARTRGGLKRALKAYVRLNRMAMQCLVPDGILLTCSCSGLVSRDEFEQVLAQAALESDREVQILQRNGQAPDHPVSVFCLETSYLKCFICRVA